MKQMVMMWERLTRILVFVCLLLSFGGASVQAEGDTDRVIKVGFFHWPGYHYYDERGHSAGYGYELIKRLSFYGDWNFQLLGYDKSWSESVKMLENGEIDVMTCVPKLPDLEEKFLYSQQPVGNFSTLLYVKEGDTRYDPLDHKTFNGMRIALRKGSANNLRLAEFARAKGFAYEPIYFATDAERYEAIRQRNDIDALLESSLTTTPSGLVVLDTFNQRPFYLIVRPEDARLLDQVDTALNQMSALDVEWQENMLRHFYPLSRLDGFYLSPGERQVLQDLAETGVALRVLVNPDNAPYSKLEMGRMIGILPEAFQAMAEILQIKYEFITVDNRAEYLKLLNQGEADIVLDLNSQDDIINDSVYHKTASYVNAHMAWIERRNVEKGGSVVLPEGTFLTGRMKEEARKQKIIYLPTVQACLEAVTDESDNARMLAYSLQARAAVLNDPYNGLMSEDIWVNNAFCLGINARLDHRLVSIFDKVVFRVRGQIVDGIIEKYERTIKPEVSVAWMISSHPFIFIGIVMVGVLGLVAFGYMVIQRRTMQRIAEQNDALRDSQQALKTALGDAQRANAAKSDFLSRMSHDIRTPMNGILGMAAIAVESLGDEAKLRESLDKITNSGRQLEALLNDVLDMSKVESGRIELEHVNFNLEELLQGIQVPFTDMMEEKQLKLLGAHYDYEHILVCGSPRHLYRIIMNLISNSVKYNKVGGTLECWLKEIPQDDKHSIYRFTIEDSGVGMSKDFLEHVFEPFSREHNDAGTKYQGTGLGMAITKEFVELMGGTIKVESELGEGSTFVVEIPLEIAEEEKATEVPLEYTVEENCLAGRRILVAEDNEMNQEIIEFLLETYGAEAVLVENGQLAVEAFRNSEPGYFDIVLMDLRMPVMDGFEATLALRGLPREDAAVIPIMAMTANAFADDVRRCLEVGMNYHMAKPIEAKKTIWTILQLLQGKKLQCV